MKTVLYLTILFLVISCLPFENGSLEITLDKKKHIMIYENQLKDTIYFESISKDLDTFIIERIDSNKTNASMMNIESQWIAVEIRHLPMNHWAGGYIHTGETLNQELINIGFFPSENQYFIGFAIRDFQGSLENFDSPRKDTLFERDFGITQYWEMDDNWEYYEDSIASVEKIYWTQEFGLTAYFKKNGDFYKLKR